MAKVKSSSGSASGNLPEAVSAKYEMYTNHGVGLYIFNGHQVNLDTISLEQADELVENGFPYLVLKPVM